MIRAFVFAWVAVLLSAFGHSLATGTTPSAGTLAAGAAAASLLFAPLARQRLSVPVSAGTLSVLQIGLHLFFSGTGALGTGASGTGAPSPMPHSMPGTAHMDMAAAPAWVAFAPTVPMACGHIAASAGIAWVLHRGDTAAGRILELAHLHAARTVSTLLQALRIRLGTGQCCLPDVVTGFGCAPRRRDPEAAGSMPLLLHEVTRRGPPQGTAVLV
ncbi:hypothetical protein ABT024_13970 [Streptomyces sp. NPDC002812]|uniref:hypothetical protein n=1 Tax=Streptomyces sp. NPDC002812 TaxID=3154434 RepID=UPI00332FB041